MTADPRGNVLHPTTATVLLIGLTAVWGSTFVLVKQAVAGYDVVSFLVLRFAVGTLCLVPVAAHKATRETWKIGALIGSVLAGSYYFQTLGLRYTTATNSGLITGLFVIFAPAFNRVLFGVRLSTRVVPAVTLALVGLVLLTGTGPTALNRGDAFTLASAAFFGLHLALLDRYSRRFSPIALTMTQIAAATGCFLLASIGRPIPPFPTAQTWFAVIVTGVFATAAGFYVQTAAQKSLSALRTALILLFEPVFAAIFGFLLAGDRLTVSQLCGGALIVGAVAVLDSPIASGKPPFLRRRVFRRQTQEITSRVE